MAGIKSKNIASYIRAVFFDHDDTLVGTIGPKWEEHKYIAKLHYDKVLTDDDIKIHWGKPLKELVCLLYGTEDAEQALAHNVSHHEKYPKLLFKETIPTLRHLKSVNKKIGIITATSRFSFEHDLKLHKVPKDLIDYSQTADDTPYHKPDHRVFVPAKEWLKKHNIRPNEVLYVGDGLHDMKAAVNAGFSFLGVETGLVKGKHFKDNGAKSVPSVGHLMQ